MSFDYSDQQAKLITRWQRAIRDDYTELFATRRAICDVNTPAVGTSSSPSAAAAGRSPGNDLILPGVSTNQRSRARPESTNGTPVVRLTSAGVPAEASRSHWLPATPGIRRCRARIDDRGRGTDKQHACLPRYRDAAERYDIRLQY